MRGKKNGKLELRCDRETVDKYKLKCLSLGMDYRKMTIEIMNALLEDRLSIIESESSRTENLEAKKVFK